MAALWVVFGIVVLLAAVLAGAAAFFFRFAICRRGREQDEKDFLKEGTIWHPFRARMEQAQEYIHAHTAEKLVISSFDGLRLSGLCLPLPGEARGVIVAFHGYRSLATVDFALEVEFFHRMGYHVVLPYQRSHGESQGRYITYGVKERFDCQSWARWAAQRFGEETPVFLMGISMGAATVLMAADLDLPESVRGIVADCGFTSPWDEMAHVARRDFKLPAFPLLYLLDLAARLRAGFGLKEGDARRSLSRGGLPVLFLHGEKDDFVPFSMTRENFAACRGEKALHTVKEAAHAQSFGMDTPGCERAIAAFLRKYGG